MIRDEIIKNFLFTGLWIIVFLALNTNVFAQTETQTEYKIIEIPQKSSTPFTFQINPIIEQYLKYYQSRGRQAMELGLARVGRNEKIIRRIFREEGVPENLFRITQIGERWIGSPRPLWSFTPSVAKRYGLRKTKLIDETRSFEKATRAMAQYLKFLYQKYDKNWELAVGAYESGEGNVDRAVKRARAKDYWKIYRYLSRETRNFVPNVLATILIANNTQKYNFSEVMKDSSFEYELVRIPPSVSLERIAEYSGTDINFINQINPELIANITPPEPYIIRVPNGAGQTFAQRMKKLLSRYRLNYPKT